MEILFILPVLIAALVTVVLAAQNKEELYVKPEVNSEQIESGGRLSIKGILKYTGIFLLISGGLYLLAILAPLIIGIVAVGVFLSSFSFFFVFGRV